MRYMALYDLMETSRNTNQWLGATAKAMGKYKGNCAKLTDLACMTFECATLGEAL